jgi:hypothetical protein
MLVILATGRQSSGGSSWPALAKSPHLSKKAGHGGVPSFSLYIMIFCSCIAGFSYKGSINRRVMIQADLGI